MNTVIGNGKISYYIHPILVYLVTVNLLPFALMQRHSDPYCLFPSVGISIEQFIQALTLPF